MHNNPALGGGLQGTPGNARVVPDIAELQLAARVFGVRSQTAAAAASTGTSLAYTFGTVAPVSPNVGDFWFKSDVGVKFTYVNDGSSSQWVEC